MCLIICSRTGRPKEEYIRNGFANHPDGTGMAWHQDGIVHYKKGLNVEETIKMAAELPVGYIIHFRWASVGGKDKSLIHPFPIRKDVPLSDSGTSKAVLFHNGHWEQWNNVLVNHLSSRLTLPKGKWSDTRAIAFLVAVHGHNILRLIESAGKFVVMHEGNNYGFGNFEEDEGVAYSNHSYKNYIRGGCGTGVSTTRTTVGTSYTPISTVTRAPIPRPSNPLIPETRSPQSVVPHDEREMLTEAEYEELKTYFEKDLAETSVIGAA